MGRAGCHGKRTRGAGGGLGEGDAPKLALTVLTHISLISLESLITESVKSQSRGYCRLPYTAH